MPDRWTAADIEAVVSLSAHGAEILQQCREGHYKIETGDSESHPPLDGAAGYCNHELRTIVLNTEYGKASAVASLAHEAEHARQNLQGETPHQQKIRELSKPEYLELRRDNEAKAETCANKVAYELAALGYREPLNKQCGGTYRAQAETYASSRNEGQPHDQAAQKSEPEWSANEFAQEYGADFGREWNQAHFPNSALFPETSSSKTGAEEKSDWARSMEAKREAARIPPPPPPPQVDAQTKSHGLAR